MMDVQTFSEFLRLLRDSCRARVCGSFARGDFDTRRHISDIDLVVPYQESLDEYGEPVATYMSKAIDIFSIFNVPGESAITGDWSSPRDLITLPRPVEVFDEFWIEPEFTATDHVIIYGVKFQTYTKPFESVDNGL